MENKYLINNAFVKLNQINKLYTMAGALEYAPITIAHNIVDNFIPYRKLPSVGEITNDNIISSIDAMGYFKIITGGTVIIIIDRDAKCSREKSEFIKYISTPIKNEYLTDEFKEVILIMDEEIIESKKNIINEIMALKGLSKNKINVYPFRNFVLPIPYCECVDHHRILSEDEIEKLFSVKYLTFEDLKIMSVNDPPIVWLGGEAGQIVEVTGKSLTAIKTVSYWRLV